jgi:hypothetical protein
MYTVLGNLIAVMWRSYYHKPKSSADVKEKSGIVDGKKNGAG